MSIVDLQRRLAEAGRIRIGQQVPTGGGRTRPAKLDTFRLTSQDKARIEAAAHRWGGQPKEWAAPTGRQWEVVTETDVLDAIVPPSDMGFSQFYELWSRGGCQRRCDGVREMIADRPCLCDPDQRECNIHTRLSVLLPDLPGLGVWRIDTSGYYAAVELGGAFQVLQMASTAGLVPARLRLEQREVKRQQDGQTQTRKFAVPVLDIDITPSQLVAIGGGGAGDGRPQGLLTPVPQDVPELPARTVAEQVQALEDPAEKPRRANAQAPIPDTGVGFDDDDEIVEATEILEGAGLVDDTDDDSKEGGDYWWDQLADMLGEDPDTTATMDVLREQVKNLYQTMAALELWPIGGLKASLKKHHDTEHLSDLRKADLVAFVEKSWQAARARWLETTG